MEQGLTGPLFFGREGRRMFGVLTPPAPGAAVRGGGWLVCSAFGEERDNAQRILVEWALSLSREGFWVFRFDHLGNGNSEGTFDQFTLSDYLDDVNVAAAELQRSAKVPLCGLCGLRLGATLAVLARGRWGADLPLLLWAPVVDGAAYADEILRVAATGETVRGQGVPTTRADLRGRLANGGTVPVRGHEVTSALLDSISAINLAGGQPYGTGPALVVEVTSRPTHRVSPSLKALCEVLGREGPVDLERAVLSPPWTVTATDYTPRPAPLFEPSLRWVRNHVASRRPRPDPGALVPGPATGPAPSLDGPAAERIVSFSSGDDRLYGILTSVPGYSAGRPVVLTPVMSALFHVRIARALHRLGWVSLRFDPHGKGESTGNLPFPTIAALHRATQAGLFAPDMVAATDLVEREVGPRPVIPLGICGEAITGVFHASLDPRVAGVAPVEMPFLYAPVGTAPGPVGRLQRFVVDRMLAHPSPVVRAIRRFLLGARWEYRRLWRRLRHAIGPRSAGRVFEVADVLGERANIELLRTILQCLDREVPMLLVYGTQRVDGPSGFERLLPRLRATSPAGAGRIVHHLVEGSDHHFSRPEHRRMVFALLSEWLADPCRPWAVPSGPGAGRFASEKEES